MDFSYDAIEMDFSRFFLCHADQPTKRKNVFEQENAAKQNVANRPLARDVGTLLDLEDSYL
jgi:hypothetical protein